MYVCMYVCMHVYISKPWTAIDRLSNTWKSDLTHKIKWGFFQTVAESVLLYAGTYLILTKHLGEKIDGD